MMVLAILLTVALTSLVWLVVGFVVCCGIGRAITLADEPQVLDDGCPCGDCPQPEHLRGNVMADEQQDTLDVVFDQVEVARLHADIDQLERGQ